jgi:adenosylcobalamin-dependent ribonucleoside-triphosphate reductase
LGHISLEAFVNDRGEFELDKAEFAAKLMTRFLIRATFGDINDPRSREIMDRNRRIGVGLLGVQAAFALMGIKYSEAADNPECWNILERLKRAVRKEARDYAFQLRIPEPVKVTTVAPTGTIAKMPGTTEGIHPIYARYFLRRIRFSTINPVEVEMLKAYEAEGFEVEDCIYAANTKVVTIPTKERLVAKIEERGLPASIVESANEIPLFEMLRFQCMIQSAWADNAVSFTANVPPGSLDSDELMELLADWLPMLKGTTIFPDNSREQAPYERISEADYLLYQMTAVSDSIDEECATGACPVR